MTPAISPSQIDIWRSCKRKWAFTYLSDLPKPEPSEAQRRGIALHAKAELYITTGRLEYDGEDDNLLAAIVPYLPQSAQAETKVTVMIDGVRFAGRYDWLTADGELGDLKTTSSLRWAKSPVQLAVNPQAVIYAKAVGAAANRCRWLYVQTRGAPAVRPVEFVPDYSGLDTIAAVGHEITKAWTDRGNPNDYPPTLSACEQYGGCPFKSVCKVDAAQRLITLLGMNTPSFDSLLAAINPPPPTEAPVLAPESSAIPTDTPTAPELPKRRKRRTKAEILADAAAELPPTLDPEKADTDPPPPAQEKPIETLYVSCLPLGQDVDFADYIFASARAKVAEQNGVEDYRLMPYGTGKGAFVAAVEHLVKDICPKNLVLDSRGPEANECLSALSALASRVVRAL